MREIKFRAWDVEESKMINGNRIYVWQGDLNNEIWGIQRGGGFILMQYTGLKDKNGKEIYEGDIVRSEYSGIDEVFYDKYGYFSPFGNSDWAIDSTDCEIIGNIYQNPELL